MNTEIVTTETPKSALALALVELEAEEPTAAVTLRAAFEEMFDDADRWAKQAASIRVTSEDDHRGMKLARETRLALREIRVKGEKARKRLKATILREGKAIDGIGNVLKALIEPLEEKLLIDETFAERAEEARIKTLGAARSETLLALGVDPTSFVNLGAMVGDVWDLTLENAKRADADRKAEAKKQEEIKLEAERIAAERVENERKEAIAREAERVAREEELKAAKAKLEAEAAQRELDAKAEREKHADEIKAKEDAAAAERKEAEAKEMAAIQAQRSADAARQKAEDELERVRKAEADRVADEEAKKDAEARRAADLADLARRKADADELAPDREKLVKLARLIREIATVSAAPDRFTTAKGKAACAKVSSNFERLASWLDKTAGEL